MLDPKALAALHANPRRFERRWFGDPLRAHLAVRSRVAEEALARAMTAGVRQYVLLGAGLDTFAFRCPDPTLRIFEVDHPRTQGWKRQRLRESRLAEPANLTFVPVDFEQQEVAVELAAAGWEPAAPTFFSWLGVVPYLEEATVWATLAWVGRSAGPGGGIVFDYAARPPAWDLRTRLAGRLLAGRLARIGEPLRTVLQPERVAERLAELGFTAVEDLDRVAINARYFAGRADGLRVRGSGRVVVAG